MLRIHRSAASGPYSSADARKFRTLLPDFSRAARIHLNQLHLTQQEVLAAAALEQLQIGVIVIDRARHILHANAFARNLLGHGGIVAVNRERLTLKDADADCALRRTIDDASRESTGPLVAAAFGLRTLWAGDCQLSISPFVDDGLLIMRHAVPEAFLVAFRRFERRPDNLAAPLISGFRLTPTEAAIVVQITEGGTLQQIAAQNSVSINTLKTHLKSIFFKMGVRSQADLVRAVFARRDHAAWAAGPPVASPAKASYPRPPLPARYLKMLIRHPR